MEVCMKTCPAILSQRHKDNIGFRCIFGSRRLVNARRASLNLGPRWVAPTKTFLIPQWDYVGLCSIYRGRKELTGLRLAGASLLECYGEPGSPRFAT